MEPSEPLPVKLTLENETSLLSHHSMLTPADHTFSVLRNPTQNFKYRGILWLTEKDLIYKGFPVTKVDAIKVSEKLIKPLCEIDVNQPYNTRIPIKNIVEVFIGHDSTFQKRFQRYPKLRITFQDNNGESTSYFYLTRENLIDDELYINKRCNEWKNKINELLGRDVEVPPTVPAIPKGPKKAPPLVPSTAGATATLAPISPAPTPPRIGTDALLDKAAEEIGAKRFGKVTVKPLEERERPKFTAVATPIQDKVEEPEPEFTKLLDALVPVSDEEFSSAAADTSIAKCPHCGWILGYSTFKCPRCRKEL